MSLFTRDSSSPVNFQKNRRAGVTTLEFAIVIPIFFLFILGLVEMGRGMMVTNLLTHAARTGCREGVLPNKANSDISAAVSQALSNQGVTGAVVTVKVNNATKDASTAQAKDEITVIVTAPVGKNTWLPVTRWLNGNLTGQYTLIRE